MTQGPRDHRLFHYTRRKSHLIAMLSDGIWPRFSEEDFSWLAGTETYLAFPVACFCDIPLNVAGDHTQKYGRYAIAIHKNYATDLDMTPVWYIREDGSYADAIRARFQTTPRFSLASAQKSLLFEFLPLMKTTVGTQPGRDSTPGGSHLALAFDEECEWRVVSKAVSSTQWLESSCRDFVSESDHKKSFRAKIKLTRDMIDTVLVRSQNDVIDLRSRFPKLAGKIKTWPKKK